jgi:hypothetical protein
MNHDYRIADYQIAEPSRAPVYAPGRCCLCGEDAAVNEDGECEACVRERREADNLV